ncbi:UbiX family flavin prenyltransferase [Chrysiogenes arsenatis]|uniref:UbiX family flavin prenyltransferase n=1 Tax=Chrysiogenes arsenatis TaxID=309797 RepID=UPI00041AD4D0|nr:UbiX family flavin prenyltransferase [Chrysiogenes arsenatis]
MKHIAVVITGASGSQLGLRMIDLLQQAGRTVSVVLTMQGATNMLLESGYSPGALATLDAETQWREAARIVHATNLYHPSDYFSPLASGSHAPDGLLVLPASMGYCARVVQGLGSTLAERVFDVCLKEGKSIFLAPRESPLHAIHLENLTKLARLRVKIVPFAPEFYTGIGTLSGQISQYLGRFAALLGVDIPHRKWGDGAGNVPPHTCFVCSSANPVGLQVPFTIDAEALTSHAHLRIGAAYQSYNGFIHGGILSALLDEAMGKIGSMAGYMIVTHDLQITLHQPLQALEPAVLTGKLFPKKWKVAHGEAMITTPEGNVIAEARGRFKIIGTLPLGVG